MLPTVDFCGLKVTRLVIGGNPFLGYSHKSGELDAEMVAYYTPDRIKETWRRAEAVGINTMITNNEMPQVVGAPNVVQAVKEYLAEGGTLQWIAQLHPFSHPSMLAAIDAAAEMGCAALYFHGGCVDALYSAQEEATLREWVRHARSHGVPVGVAGHAPEVHDWVDSLDLVDFHAVCFFNCGSLHSGQGYRFRLADAFAATACIRRLRKPCIGYKILGSGRLDPTMAFEFAFGGIKPSDVVNVGMHRGDKDDMVEENAALVRTVLGA